MLRPATDKKPLLQHLREVERQTGIKPDTLAEAEEEAPLAVRYMEAWYLELAAARSGNGFGGLNRISYADIHAWAALTGRAPTPQEVECLLMLDSIYIEEVTAKESADG